VQESAGTSSEERGKRIIAGSKKTRPERKVEGGKSAGGTLQLHPPRNGQIRYRWLVQEGQKSPVDKEECEDLVRNDELSSPKLRGGTDNRRKKKNGEEGRPRGKGESGAPSGRCRS